MNKRRNKAGLRHRVLKFLRRFRLERFRDPAITVFRKNLNAIETVSRRRVNGVFDSAGNRFVNSEVRHFQTLRTLKNKRSTRRRQLETRRVARRKRVVVKTLINGCLRRCSRLQLANDELRTVEQTRRKNTRSQTARNDRRRVADSISAGVVTRENSLVWRG